MCEYLQGFTYHSLVRNTFDSYPLSSLTLGTRHTRRSLGSLNGKEPNTFTKSLCHFNFKLNIYIYICLWSTIHSYKSLPSNSESSKMRHLHNKAYFFIWILMDLIYFLFCWWPLIFNMFFSKELLSKWCWVSATIPEVLGVQEGRKDL